MDKFAFFEKCFTPLLFFPLHEVYLLFLKNSFEYVFWHTAIF